MPPPSRGSETILVVEDEEIVRKVVVKRLQRQGYHVLEGRNGKEALAVLESFTGSVDLIITDVIMPEMNGRDLVAQIRQRYPQVVVLYMSGYPRDIMAQQGILESGIEFIEKTSVVTDLLGKVQRLLSKRDPQPPPLR